MRDKARRVPAIVGLALAALLIIGALPTMATAPQPVIPVDGGTGWGKTVARATGSRRPRSSPRIASSGRRERARHWRATRDP